MKVVILAGGYGSRLSEYTDRIPKPMVKIGSKPILWHIMQLYAHYGFNDFIVALGYKGDCIKDYFLNYPTLDKDFSVDLRTGHLNYIKESQTDWKVTLIDTGLETMTGGRLLRLRNHLGNDPFMLTYGDGVSDINISALVDFHYSHNKLLTVSAVRPPARFGELVLDGTKVTNFAEKPQLHDGWISGGFFVVNPRILSYIKHDQIMFEREPIEKAVQLDQVAAYKHDGFWQCMDTKRDHEYLEQRYSESAPWILQ